MTEIPDDVMRNASKIANEIVRNYELNLPANIGIDVIARAILAERDRCAKVADSHPNAHHTAIRDAILHPK